MKLWLVMESEQYGCSYPVKIFKSKEKARYFANQCIESRDAKELGLYYSLREIEADLDEWQ